MGGGGPGAPSTEYKRPGRFRPCLSQTGAKPTRTFVLGTWSKAKAGRATHMPPARLKFGSRVKQAADYVNTHYEVDALQMELPARLQTLIAREGGRIGK